jgi:5-methylcytosine-specific restriction endonuclease McrA
LKPPNENIEVADGIVVTRNVREHLKKQAHRDITHTRKSQLAGRWGDANSLVSWIVMPILTIILLTFLPLSYAPYTVTISFLLWISGLLVEHICNRIEENERTKQMPEINARLEELARERQRQIDETNTFYASSEWRLVREQVIQEQGRVCQECRSRITDDFDLTVDHIKPRSKFPELALDKSNLQVLCRRCNSAKGAIYNEENTSAQLSMRLS